MFTRVVECQVKPEKRDELTTKLRNDVLPILKRQPGFVDMIGLVHETDQNRLVAISFWNTKEDAERYNREHYREVLEVIKPMIKKDPHVDHFHVDTSTTHRIQAGKAA